MVIITCIHNISPVDSRAGDEIIKKFKFADVDEVTKFSAEITTHNFCLTPLFEDFQWVAISTRYDYNFMSKAILFFYIILFK